MDIRRGAPESFMQRMQSMFADTDYKITGKMELYFQNAMYLVFKMLGFYTDVERTTSNGRIDIVLKTKDYIYVMELKLDGTADDALRQIEEKDYALPLPKIPANYIR
ncbi:PD-(D/E)XK nuclease domain-containing protein [Bacteroides sp. CR5/BHMF/2]|nr:PD-(D/E)XK nuclease domain-containing protein [Bacteroides sp. CR5/BHMF/2]